MNEIQGKAIAVLAEAGHPDARWWGPQGQPANRIYFTGVTKPTRIYITFTVPETLEGPRLCVDLQDCRQRPSWYEGQRRARARKYFEGYARIIGLFDDEMERQFRMGLETAELLDDFSIVDVGGRTLTRE